MSLALLIYGSEYGFNFYQPSRLLVSIGVTCSFVASVFMVRSFLEKGLNIICRHTYCDSAVSLYNLQVGLLTHLVIYCTLFVLTVSFLYKYMT